MSIAGRLATRAKLPGLGAGLSNTLPSGGGGGGKGSPKAATRNVSWVTPNQPLYDQSAGQGGIYQYFASVWVMRCVRTIADTIASLPYRAGLDVDQPTTFNPTAPLAKLLGPATPQAPGGPNPVATSRELWAWSIAQYVLTGKMAWELDTDGPKGPIISLWPLVSQFLAPIPSEGSARYWKGFSYKLPTGAIPLTPDQVFYAWRPSQQDWRQPESVLDSARDVVNVQVALDRYHSNLLKNQLLNGTLVITPPFEEAAEKRAFQEQFRQEFGGYDNAGKPIFVEREYDSGNPNDKGDVSIERIAQTAEDAQLTSIAQQAKIDITTALGVPESLIGNASQRTYANADAEYRNFWTITVIPLIMELQDKVNVGLAPRLGKEVGWFDVSHVSALKPPSIIAQPSIPDLITSGVATAPQIADLLGLSGGDSATDTESVEEIPVGSAEQPGLSMTKVAPGVASRSDPHAHETLLSVTSKVAELRGRRQARDEVRVGPHGYIHGWIKVGDDGATATAEVSRAIGVHHRRLSDHPAFAKEQQRLSGAAEKAPDSLLHSNFTDSMLRAKDAQKKGNEAAAAKHLATAVASERALRHRGKAPMFHNTQMRQVAEFASTGPGPSVPLGNNYDASNAGLMLPVGDRPHRFAGRKLLACDTCGRAFADPIHIRPKTEKRHRGPAGHHHVSSGHVVTKAKVAAEKASFLSDVGAAEGPLTDALKGVFADQRKATLSRLQGKRGRQMLRDLERRQNKPPNTTGPTTPPPTTLGPAAVFTAPFWTDKTTTAVQPALAAVGTQAMSRVRRQLGHPAVNDSGSLGTMQRRLAERAQRLAQQVTKTTANQISQALAEGASEGEGVEQIAGRINKVFDNADMNRARVIARTEVVGAANQAAQDYASALPPGIVGRKRWMAHHDDRTRPDHRITDGQTVAIHEPYHVGVAGHPAMYPGDPTLPPDEVIQCRCAQIFLPGDAVAQVAS